MQFGPTPGSSNLIGGRYEIVQLLGSGGHGAVHRAIQRPLGREVALKMLHAEVMIAPGSRERFAREAGLVKRLEHPNTVRLYDYGTTDDGLPFMVFELLRGRPLDEEITRAPLNAYRTGRVAMQVLKALMEAHAIGIIHRDIKPSNILLVDYAGEDDFVKVLDFGVARAQVVDARGGQITGQGQVVGTPSYMPPEQASGTSMGPQTDLYALGLLMIEAMTGQPVYTAPTPLAVLLMQASPEPVPIPQMIAGTPFGPIIARATRKAVEERYPTAQAMLADIERAMLAFTAPTDPLAKPMSSSSASPLAMTQMPYPSTSPMRMTPPPPTPHTVAMTPSNGPPNAAAPTPYPGAPSPSSSPNRWLIAALVIVSGSLIIVLGGVGLWWYRRRPTTTTITLVPRPASTEQIDNKAGQVLRARLKTDLEHDGFKVTEVDSPIVGPMGTVTFSAYKGTDYYQVALILLDDHTGEASYESTFVGMQNGYESSNSSCMRAPRRLMCVYALINGKTDRGGAERFAKKVWK